MKLPILFIFFFSHLSMASETKDKSQLLKYHQQLVEYLKVGQSMEVVKDYKECNQKKDKYRKLTESLYKPAMAVMDEYPNFYNASVNVWGCINCLRVSASKDCNKAVIFLDKFKKNISK